MTYPKNNQATMNKLLELSNSELVQALCPSPITHDAWTFSGEELREAIQGDRLLNVSLDLSNECNLNCPYCFTAPAKSSQRDKSTDCLSFEEYKEIVTQLKEAGTKTINIIGAGEPTMYAYFDELVKFISLQGIKVCVSTNGILLASQNKRIDLLNEINATIILKVNSRNSHLQDLLVGRNGYASIRDNTLKKLMSKGFNKNMPTRLAINTLLIKPIYTELFDIFVFCRENNISLIASVYMPTGRTSGLVFQGKEAIPNNFHVLDDLYQPLTEDDIAKLLIQLKDYDKRNNISRAPHPAYISGIACTQLLGIQIDNRGKVWSCPARKLLNQGKIEEKPLESTNTKDFLSIWKSTGTLSIRSVYNGECIYKGKLNKY